MKVTRKALMRYIERSIPEEMPDNEKMLLRHVAATEKRLNRGTYTPRYGACGCPLTAAGLYSEVEEKSLPSWRQSFADAFDGETRPAATLQGEDYVLSGELSKVMYVIEVVD